MPRSGRGATDFDEVSQILRSIIGNCLVSRTAESIKACLLHPIVPLDRENGGPLSRCIYRINDTPKSKH